jgi:Abortive infection C-terminus
LHKTRRYFRKESRADLIKRRAPRPLCPAGHLPHKEGDWKLRRLCFLVNTAKRAKTVPPEGELAGKPEGAPRADHCLCEQEKFSGVGERLAAEYVITMIDESELPASVLERAAMLENLLSARATGDVSASTEIYEFLRREFMADHQLKALLPNFVRTCRTLDVFWPFIKQQAGTYAERRQIIGAGFTPLVDHLEGAFRSPGDGVVSSALESFDTEGVHAVWQKAIGRRGTDPEGAITLARTLLEAVCKRILDDGSITYLDKEDLPKLYFLTAKALNLAPDQHSVEAIKAILGGAMSVVNGIGTLRNKLSDSHGRGGKPVKPSPRHASLAVNMAGALATFLVETSLEKTSKQHR